MDENRAAASGQVVLSEVNADTIAGSLDLVFPKGEHFKGDFRVPVCAIVRHDQPQLPCQTP
jgi:hypothetical protein